MYLFTIKHFKLGTSVGGVTKIHPRIHSICSWKWTTLLVYFLKIAMDRIGRKLRQSINTSPCSNKKYEGHNRIKSVKVWQHWVNLFTLSFQDTLALGLPFCSRSTFWLPRYLEIIFTYSGKSLQCTDVAKQNNCSQVNLQIVLNSGVLLTHYKCRPTCESPSNAACAYIRTDSSRSLDWFWYP